MTTQRDSLVALIRIHFRRCSSGARTDEDTTNTHDATLSAILMNAAHCGVLPDRVTHPSCRDEGEVGDPKHVLTTPSQDFYLFRRPVARLGGYDAVRTPDQTNCIGPGRQVGRIRHCSHPSAIQKIAPSLPGWVVHTVCTCSMLFGCKSHPVNKSF